ncbi:MAG: glycosyltransferase family 4 protein [Lentisphaeria bacterium]|nr:glycosyltransferase family 4 protein [Lentisphaeria bacterium]
MPRIRFVNQYAGIIGGIERYMERTALLLRRNGFTVDCCYAEKTQVSVRFLAAFDHAETISDAIERNGSDYDLTVLHKVRDAEAVRALRNAGRTAVFIHDHEYYCPRRAYYYPVTRKNCSRAYSEFLCGCCAMLRRPSPDNTFRANFGGFASLWREIRACDEFIVLSEFMRNILVRQGIPAEKITLIPPAITIPDSVSFAETDAVPHILAIGQLIRGKGVDQLLAAMHSVKTPCVLDIVGTGNDEAYLKQLAEPLGEKVVFHGYSPNPDDAFRGVRAVVLPWRWQEPFGLVGPEALAHGVPLVGFDVGAIRDYLVDGQTGVLVPPGDTDALSKAIDRLLNNPDEAHAMGLCGRELVSARFTDAVLLNGWQALLNSKQDART